MKVVDGKNAVMGRLASYVAKESLRGEDMVVLNCDQVIITGNKKRIVERFEVLRRKGGNSQKGPKHLKTSFRIVKRAIRGMLPDHRFGRGRIAFKRIKCYNGVPPEFEEVKKIVAGKDKTCKFIEVKELTK